MAANEITVKLDRVSKSFGEFTAVKELSLSKYELIWSSVCTREISTGTYFFHQTFSNVGRAFQAGESTGN